MHVEWHSTQKRFDIIESVAIFSREQLFTVWTIGNIAGVCTYAQHITMKYSSLFDISMYLYAVNTLFRVRCPRKLPLFLRSDILCRHFKNWKFDSWTTVTTVVMFYCDLWTECQAYHGTRSQYTHVQATYQLIDIGYTEINCCILLALSIDIICINYEMFRVYTNCDLRVQVRVTSTLIK